MKVEEGKKKYALLLAAPDSEYVKKMYGGYFNVFVGAFGGEDEEWDLYRVVEGELPELKDIDKYNGYVISGSPFDAYGDDGWILKLCLLLQILNVMQKKMLGVCFGHQLLCRAMGGKVGKSYSGWDIGLRKVTFAEDLRPSHLLEQLVQVPPFASIIECHQDEVWEPPIGAEVIAFSEKTRVEVFSVGDHILGIQGHPEYTKDILFDIIDRLQVNNSIERGFADDAKAALDASEPSREFWEKMCKSFLHGR